MVIEQTDFVLFPLPSEFNSTSPTMWSPSISATGRYVAYELLNSFNYYSENIWHHVFFFDMQTREGHWASVTSRG